jgi:hypothetical protein
MANERKHRTGLALAFALATFGGRHFVGSDVPAVKRTAGSDDRRQAAELKRARRRARRLREKQRGR